jgi:DNA end-binding protein Ku
MGAKTKHKSGERGVRAFWSGTLSFGLVSVPVHLFPASRSGSTSLRMLGPNGVPVRRRYYCPEENRDVPDEHILRGYERDAGKYIVVRDEELESLQPRKSRDIELRRFVDRAEIPPLYFERPYFLTPAGDSTKAYRLLADVIERMDRVGIASFVMRDKEYLVAILAEKGILRAETLRFQSEIRNPGELGFSPTKQHDPELVAKFERAIERHAAKQLSERELQDEYAERLHKLVERKRRRGRDVVEVEQDVPEDVDVADETGEVDLLETIRRSLQGGNGVASHNGHGARRRTGHRVDPVTQSKDQLSRRAGKLKIPGRGEMTKQELIRAIRRRG